MKNKIVGLMLAAMMFCCLFSCSESEDYMPNIPKIQIGNTVYNVKDEEARDRIASFRSMTDLQSEIVYGEYINCSDAVGSTISLTPASNASFCYAIIDCSPGDIFVVSGTTTTVTDVCVFVNSANKILYKSRPNVTKLNSTVVAPPNAAKMVYSVRSTSYHSLSRYDGYVGDILITSDENTFSSYATDITGLVANNGTGAIRLGKGLFYCDAVTMTAGTVIFGDGISTKIVLNSGNTLFTMNDYCEIHDCTIYGGNAVTPSAKGDKKGIVINQKMSCVVDNVVLSYFDNCAIEVTNTGTALSHVRSPKLTNVSCYQNYTGLMIGEHGEFVQCTNCNFSKNYVGCFNGGGNNIFVNCFMNDNVDVGFYVTAASPDYPNGGHGSAIGCIFNHNTGYAIQCVSNHIGYIFEGCQSFYGEILLDNCALICFNGCEFGSLDSITINGGKYNLFVNNMFQTNIDLDLTNSSTDFINNKDKDGNTIEPE